MSQAYPFSSGGTVMDNDAIMNENDDTSLDEPARNRTSGELEQSASTHLLTILCRR